MDDTLRVKLGRLDDLAVRLEQDAADLCGIASQYLLAKLLELGAATRGHKGLGAMVATERFLLPIEQVERSRTRLYPLLDVMAYDINALLSTEGITLRFETDKVEVSIRRELKDSVCTGVVFEAWVQPASKTTGGEAQ